MMELDGCHGAYNKRHQVKEKYHLIYWTYVGQIFSLLFFGS